MCGLVGYVGTTTLVEKKIFSTLFMTNALRGSHGCGLISVYEKWNNKKGKHETYYDTIKSEWPSSAYIHEPEYDEFINKGVMKALLGHSRHATKGKITIDNNHPFETKNAQILGMHNGTISGEFENTKDYETDSEALFNLIEKYGLTKALNIIHDASWKPAYALQYYNADEGTITLIRNKERPLYLAIHKKADKVFWASEALMLHFALIRGGEKEDYEILPLDEHTLITIDPINPKNFTIEKDYYKEPIKSITYNYNDNYNYNNHSRTRGKNYKIVNKPYEQSSDQNRDIYVGNFKLSERQFQNILQKGCCTCCGVSSYDETAGDEIKFDFRFPAGQVSEYICENCVENYSIEELADRGVGPLVRPEIVKVG